MSAHTLFPWQLPLRKCLNYEDCGVEFIPENDAGFDMGYFCSEGCEEDFVASHDPEVRQRLDDYDPFGDE